jgi:hypothetical protein
MCPGYAGSDFTERVCLGLRRCRMGAVSTVRGSDRRGMRVAARRDIVAALFDASQLTNKARPNSDSRPQNRVRVHLLDKISKSAKTASNQTMSTSNTETQVEAPAAKAVVPKQKKLKPARKQVKPGDVDKETAPQTGKEYSACPT